MRIFVLISCLIFSDVLSYAHAQPHTSQHGKPKEQQLALQYMDALTSQDLDNIKQFYNRDSIYIDKTAARQYKGERFIIDFLKRAYQGVQEYHFQIDHIYNTGSLVVMIGNYHFKGAGDQFGKPGTIIDIAIPGVTSLTLDLHNKRVKEHVDLLDYQTMMEQLATQ